MPMEIMHQDLANLYSLLWRQEQELIRLQGLVNEYEREMQHAQEMRRTVPDAALSERLGL